MNNFTLVIRRIIDSNWYFGFLRRVVKQVRISFLAKVFRPIYPSPPFFIPTHTETYKHARPHTHICTCTNGLSSEQTSCIVNVDEFV